jgi:NAD(P)-dependent dehydrogenase (short-subunit alcohol dehydrogenase family)
MRVFITGSADGLGQMAGKLLVDLGHQVVLHARNEQRATQARAALPGAEAVVIGDLSTIAATISVAEQVNKIGDFDAVIHNAAMGYREQNRIVTADGLSQLFAVNSLAPYILTTLIRRPKRLIYLSSGLHRQGDATLKDLNWEKRTWNGYRAYSDSKFHNVLLAFAIARKWPNTFSNALEPGWVATKMGGPGATDDLEQGFVTQVWLAVSKDAAPMSSGGYFYHQQPQSVNPAARNPELQDKFLSECARLSGIGPIGE